MASCAVIWKIPATINNNNKLYLQDHTSTYTVLQNYMNCKLIYSNVFISSLIKTFTGNWVK